jgi:N utilization substance protein A
MSVTSANRLELLQIADAVAREKMIDPALVIEAMEDSLGKAARSRYGAEYDIRAKIDRKTGDLAMTRYRHVVEEPENLFTELTLDDARRIKPDAALDDWLIDPLPPMDFGRIAAQSAKQVIMQKVREAERLRQYEEFKDRQGEIINGIVKRTEYGNVIVDVGRGEAILRRDQLIQREAFRNGDRVRALIREVRHETRGPQIFLSRTAPEFLAELFKMEVPEIYDNIIEIKAVARDPGSRAKMGVISYDSSIDPVGACVGMRGSRVQAVMNELQGEKIDIIPWNQDPATFLVNALQPAEVSKVVLDPEDARVEVVVAEAQLSLAIGRRGQNVRLASQLTGWSIDILTEAEESERRQKEFAVRSELFIKALEVDEMFAQLLASEGFESVEEIAYVDQIELASIEGLNDEIADELQARARDYLDKLAAELEAKRKDLGVADDLAKVPGLTGPMLVALGEKGVKTLDDFAGFTGYELRGWFETRNGERVREPGALEDFQLTQEQADALILNARIAAGWIEAPPEPEVVEEERGADDDIASVFPDRS